MEVEGTTTFRKQYWSLKPIKTGISIHRRILCLKAGKAFEFNQNTTE